MNIRPAILFFLAFTFSVTAQQQTVGVFVNEEEASDGYVFFSPMGWDKAYLIDNCGYKVNEWPAHGFPGLSGYLTEEGTMLRSNKVDFPEYFQYSTGGLLELRDFDGELLWEYEFNTYEYIQHHDAILMPNGNILFIGWERIYPDEQRNLGRREQDISYPDLWGEFVWEITPVGSDDMEVVWEWHLKDHFIQDEDSSLANFGTISDNIGKVDINYIGPGAWDIDDWWHCNAIAYNEDLDQVLLNSRNNNETWILDHSTTTAEARTDSGGRSGKGGDLIFRWGNPQAYDRGTTSNLRMYGSHGHYWIPEGLPNASKIMYFNNGDDRPEGYYSTIELLELNPDENGNYPLDAQNRYLPTEPEIAYEDPENPFGFMSQFLSNGQQLPNGNIFINEGGSGRLFEVTPEGETVWEYVNPIRWTGPMNQGSSVSGNRIFRAYRYLPDYPGLEGQDLTPGDQIELNSDIDICLNVSNENQVLLDDVTITYNAFTKEVIVQSGLPLGSHIYVYDVGGSLIDSRPMVADRENISLAAQPLGMYLIVLVDEATNASTSRKVVNY